MTMQMLLARRRMMMPQQGDTLLYVIDGSDIKLRNAVSTSPPYYGSNFFRHSYYQFDLLLDGGHSYRFDFDTNVSYDYNIGPQFFTQQILDTVNNNGTIDNNYRYAPGWFANHAVVATPVDVLGSPIVGVRFTFKRTDDAALTNDITITQVRIYKV